MLLTKRKKERKKSKTTFRLNVGMSLGLLQPPGNAFA
jgi:hypothetical protein